ncbi:MAG TPA: NRAMP family divalent metal transporter [Steroidobacteraceae bacterium]|nr:NRAMP family divalent metal transporter [Steroidobacteraceae bacterium]
MIHTHERVRPHRARADAHSPARSDSHNSALSQAHSPARADAHGTDIRGALGSVRQDDVGPRTNWAHRLRTFLAILGPGLIVMVGDNDAGAFSTYAQAGQNYGTSLLWTLALLIPVLYVNQEMVLRLGAIAGVGHAKLILRRFGKFWGAFSVIDLFVLNALTLVTEFIGISLGLGVLGVPKAWGLAAAAVMIMAAVSTGDFRRFERFALALVFGSLLVVPVFFMVRPPWVEIAHDFVVPQLPPRAHLADVMLLIIAIVGTTVAPWQLFFQQSYVIDKRIGARFINYERVDLIIGIVLVTVGAVAMIAFCAHAFKGTAEFGHFTDAGAVAAGLSRRHGSGLPGVLFAIGLIDASIIGAAAVSLSSVYAIGDVFSMRHSLNHSPRQAKLFYGLYFCLIVAAAALVLIPGVPLGLLTNAVQTLAGVLLPSASVFLLLLCNDEELLGPWVNSFRLNALTMFIVALLVTLSLILTAAVLFPAISGVQIGTILGLGTGLATISVAVYALRAKRVRALDRGELQLARIAWRMPGIDTIGAIRLTPMRRLFMMVLRGYLVVAVVMVIVRVIQTAAG